MSDPTVPTAIGQVALLVRDIDATVAVYRDTPGLERAGVAVTSPPAPIHTHTDGTEEWMAFSADPAGNTLALMTTRQGPTG